jgi:hypothetical protein
MLRYLRQRARFFKEVRGPRDNAQLFLGSQPGIGLLVESDDLLIVAPDDQQSWRLDAR